MHINYPVTNKEIMNRERVNKEVMNRERVNKEVMMMIIIIILSLLLLLLLLSLNISFEFNAFFEIYDKQNELLHFMSVVQEPLIVAIVL